MPDNSVVDRITSALCELADELRLDEDENEEVENEEEEDEFSVEYDSLFYTTTGGELSTNTSDLLGFIFSTSMFSLPFDKIIKEGMRFITSSDFEKRVMESDDGSEETQAFFHLKDLLESYPHIFEISDAFPLFKAEDVGRFFALLILSISAYLDEYVNEMMKTVLENQHYCQQMVQILESKYGNIIRYSDLIDFTEKPVKALNSIINQYAPKNAAARLDLILQTLRVDKAIEGIVKQLNLGFCRSDLSKFIDIRGKVAHSKPSMTIEIFSREYSDERYEKVRNAFFAAFAKLPNGQPDNPMTGTITKIFLDKTDLFASVFRIPLMALAYPALVDRVVAEVMGIRENGDC